MLQQASFQCDIGMEYFLSLSKSAAIHRLEDSEWGLLFFGLVVFVGIWGEIKSESHSKRLKIFEYVVLYGILGELISDGGVFLCSTQLQTISDREFAVLNKEAGDARKDASAAIERAGKAVKDAADANERASKNEKEAAALRLKLANSSIPRSLEEAAQRRVAAKLPPRFTGQVNVMYLPWAFDGLGLARHIDRACTKAGLRRLDLEATRTEKRAPLPVSRHHLCAYL
jgi:hypothetical protein